MFELIELNHPIAIAVIFLEKSFGLIDLHPIW